MSRKRISDRAKLAALTMLHFGIPYAHAKLMTDYQINSLVHWHHNVHHAAKGKQTVVPDVDHFSNLEPMLIAAHREQTKHDAAVIAKIKRTKDQYPWEGARALERMGQAISDGWAKGCKTAYERIMAQEKEDKAFERWAKTKRRNARRIRSRGFDKTRRRTMRGKVVPR